MVFKKQKSYAQAFTIVELLIVIVIIGILAAITVVSYTGITKKANESTLQADLATAKKQFELYKADHGVYPTGLENGTNCLTGTTQPNPDIRYCLKSSGGSIYVLEDATGIDYTLKLSKGAIAYKITKDLAPTSTTAVVAAASFVKTWGNIGTEAGQSVIKTSDGGYAMVGSTNSYGAGVSDMFLAKYDLGGNLTWSRVWGGTADDAGYNLAQTGDGGYVVTGYTYSFGTAGDVLLAKYDTNGSLVWNKTWGGTGYEYGQDIVHFEDGSFVIAGQTTSYGSGNNDVFISKYDANGTIIWNKVWGGSTDDCGLGLTKTNDGGYVITGYTRSYGASNKDMFLAKYDTNGNLSWNKTWGGASYDQGNSVTQTADGGYAVAGYTGNFGAGTVDMFIAKYDPSGNLSWNKTWGGADDDRGLSLAQSSDGGYVVAGSTTGYGAGSWDIILVKYNTDGSFGWNKTWGGAGLEESFNVIISDDSYVIAGRTASYGSGNDDALFIKYKSDGTINNCSSPMCQTPTATITTPSATTTTPSATVSSPSATITTPTATVSSPTATVTTVVAP